MGFLNEKGLERLWSHITARLGAKVDKISGKGLSANDYTDEEKTKLAGIADGATNVVVDSELNADSANPVQNSVISNALDAINSLVGDKTVSEQINEALANCAQEVVVEGNGNVVTDLTQNGSVITATTGAYGIVRKEGPMVQEECAEGMGIAVTVNLELNQEGSGEVSPDNIRPFVGYDTISITRSGKNLMPNWEAGTISSGNGNNANSDTVIRCIDYIPVVPNTLYTISRVGSGNSFAVRCYDKDKNYIGIGGTGTTTVVGISESIPMNANRNTATIKVKEGCYFLRFTDSTTNLTNQYQMEVGETATAYEPHKAETYSLSLGDTYYQGSVDWNTGEMVIDKKGYVITGTEDWTRQTVADKTKYKYRLIDVITDYIPPVLTASMPDVICSHYRAISADWMYSSTNGISLARTGATIDFYDSNYDTGDIDSWKAYLAEQYNAGTPVQIVYTLKEPEVVKLEPQTIKALSGTNTLTTDTGSMTVDFNRDVYAAIMEATEEDVTNLLIQLNVIPYVQDESGNIMTDENGAILLV